MSLCGFSVLICYFSHAVLLVLVVPSSAGRGFCLRINLIAQDDVRVRRRTVPAVSAYIVCAAVPLSGGSDVCVSVSTLQIRSPTQRGSATPAEPPQRRDGPHRVSYNCSATSELPRWRHRDMSPSVSSGTANTTPRHLAATVGGLEV